MPDDDASVVAWRLAAPEETPGGATTVKNAAIKAGWDVRVGYSSGPWLKSKDDDEDEDIDPDQVKICEMVTVQGRKDGKRFRGVWHRKLWTKPGREGKYIFAGAAMMPGVVGAIASTKARKAWHEESLGDETVGGLKNSKTLANYIKEN